MRHHRKTDGGVNIRAAQKVNQRRRASLIQLFESLAGGCVREFFTRAHTKERTKRALTVVDGEEAFCISSRDPEGKRTGVEVEVGRLQPHHFHARRRILGDARVVHWLHSQRRVVILIADFD